MRARRGKTLSEADIALWRQVARTVKPLPGRLPVAPEPVAAVPKPAPIEAPALVLKVALAKPVLPTPKPLAPIERRLRTQLRRGQQEVLQEAIDSGAITIVGEA